MRKLRMLVAAIMMLSATAFAKVPAKKQAKETVKTEKKEVKKVPAAKHKKAKTVKAESK